MLNMLGANRLAGTCGQSAGDRAELSQHIYAERPFDWRTRIGDGVIQRSCFSARRPASRGETELTLTAVDALARIEDAVEAGVAENRGNAEGMDDETAKQNGGR